MGSLSHHRLKCSASVNWTDCWVRSPRRVNGRQEALFSGYDRAVLRSEVVVREWRADQDTYLVRQANGHAGYFVGEAPFIDRKNFLSITVQSMGSNGEAATVSVNMRFNKSSDCPGQSRRDRDQCKSDSRFPGNKSLQQCMRDYNDCIRSCSQ